MFFLAYTYFIYLFTLKVFSSSLILLLYSRCAVANHKNEKFMDECELDHKTKYCVKSE